MNDNLMANLKEVAAVALCFAICAVVLGFFLFEPMRTQKFWLGDKGWLEVAAPIGAVIAATIAAIMSLQTYRLGQQKDLGERFRDGIELIESSNPSKRGGGLIILEDIALSAPNSRHSRWVSEILKNTIEDWSKSEIALLPDPSTWGGLTFPQMAPTTLRGLFAYLQVTKSSRAISGLYLAEVRIQDQDLSELNLIWAVIAGVDFVRCNLRDAKITRRIFDTLSIDDCDFVRGSLRLGPASECDVEVVDSDLSGASIFVPTKSTIVLKRCKLDMTRIRGRGNVVLENCWFKEDEPDLDEAAIANPPGSTLFRATVTGTSFVTKRGWVGWLPAASDKPINLSRS